MSFLCRQNFHFVIFLWISWSLFKISSISLISSISSFSGRNFFHRTICEFSDHFQFHQKKNIFNYFRNRFLVLIVLHKSQTAIVQFLNNSPIAKVSIFVTYFFASNVQYSKCFFGCNSIWNERYFNDQV